MLCHWSDGDIWEDLKPLILRIKLKKDGIKITANRILKNGLLKEIKQNIFI